MMVLYEIGTEKPSSEHEANTTGLLPKRSAWVVRTERMLNALKLSCNQINSNTSLIRFSSKKDYFNIKGRKPRDTQSISANILGSWKPVYFSTCLFLYVGFKAAQYIYIHTSILYTHVQAILKTRSSFILKQFQGNSPTVFCYLYTNTYNQKTRLYLTEKAKSYHGSASQGIYLL